MLLQKSTLKPGKTVQICGSKSISNRLLILNALFSNIKIENLSDSEDTALLQDALQSEKKIIDINHAGTAMRFLTAYCAIQPGKTVTLTGSERMRQRPIAPLVDALRSLGAEIEYLEKEGFPPLKISGTNIRKSNVEIDADISSQFITALMLIGAKLENGIHILLKGKVTSKTYILLTAKVLKIAGMDVELTDDAITVHHLKEGENGNRISHYHVESDWSSASYFYALAALGQEHISLRNFKAHSKQGDSRLREIFWEYFGVNTVSDTQEYEITLSKEPKELPESICLDLNDCPDITQTVCVAAAALKIPFEFTGLETLKIKETDRLTALQNELKKIGCITEITENSIKTVEFVNPDAEIIINTYNDHRMAMSFAPYCLIDRLTIENPGVVEKSYPKFWDDLSEILEEVNN